MTFGGRLGAWVVSVSLAALPCRGWARSEPPGEAETEPPGEAEPPGRSAEDEPAAGAAEVAPRSHGADADPRPAPQFGHADADPPATRGPEPEPTFDTIPGGYWGPTDTKELPPPDGQRKILVGSILVPLGTLATVSGGVFTYLSVPQHCVRRLAGVGLETDRSRCGGLFALNVIRTSYGALMLISGGVLLLLGLRERRARRAWDGHHTAQRGRRVHFRFSARSDGLRVRF